MSLQNQSGLLGDIQGHTSEIVGMFRGNLQVRILILQHSLFVFFVKILTSEDPNKIHYNFNASVNPKKKDRNDRDIISVSSFGFYKWILILITAATQSIANA